MALRLGHFYGFDSIHNVHAMEAVGAGRPAELGPPIRVPELDRDGPGRSTAEANDAQTATRSPVSGSGRPMVVSRRAPFVVVGAYQCG